MYLNIVAFCMSWSGAVKIKRLRGSRVPGYLSSSGINDHHLYGRRGYRYVLRSLQHTRVYVHNENTLLIFVVALTFLTISEITSCSRRFSPEELSTNALPDFSTSISKICYSPNCSYLGWLWRHNEDRRNDKKDVVSRG